MSYVKGAKYMPLQETCLINLFLLVSQEGREMEQCSAVQDYLGLVISTSNNITYSS